MVDSELKSGNTAYGKLSEEQQLYIWYIYDLLRSENIFSLANVDTYATVFIMTGYTIRCLSQLLTHGISKNWIDKSSLSSEKYTSLQSHMMHLLIILFQHLILIQHFLRKCTNIRLMLEVFQEDRCVCFFMNRAFLI